jgi:hypothetical protein
VVLSSHYFQILIVFSCAPLSSYSAFECTSSVRLLLLLLSLLLLLVLLMVGVANADVIAGAGADADADALLLCAFPCQ